MFDELSRDLRHTVRSLTRRPAFSIVVLLTLALGLGVNTALFSVVNSVLLTPLPYPEPDRLVRIYETVRRNAVERRSFSYPDFRDLRDATQSLAAVAAYEDVALTWSHGEGAERLLVEVVSPGYFKLVGVPLARGRGLAAESLEGDSGREEATARSQGAREVVLSYRFWQERLGAAADVLGRPLILDEEPHEVVGVAPQGFRGLTDGAQMWLSLPATEGFDLDVRDSRWHAVVGRLAPGIELETAQREVSTLFRNLEAEYADTNSHYGALLVPLAEDTFGSLRGPLWVLLAAVGFVLLIACANVANLLLVRATNRRRETALRSTLGAGRRRLLRHGMAEAVLLSLGGGVGGVLVAVWAVDLLAAMAPVELPSFVRLGVDTEVLAFSLVLALGTGLALGLVTSLKAAFATPGEILKDQAARTTVRPGSLRNLLLVAEVALALVVAVGAGLMLESWQRLVRLDPGYRTDNVGILRIQLPTPPVETGPSDAELSNREREASVHRFREALRARILETLHRQTGVESAALASDVPLSGARATVVTPAGTARDPTLPYQGGSRLYRHLVSPGYFETLEIPLLRGRSFSSADHLDTPAVAVVSRSAAERLWPGEDPLGQRFKPGLPPEPHPRSPDGEEIEWVTVVGVVEDVAQRTLLPSPVGTPDDPDLYFSLAQFPSNPVAAVVRTATAPETALPMLRRSVAELHPEMPVYLPQTLAGLRARETARTRFSTSLLSLFALLAMLLAAVGVYGVVTYQVVERNREIGIRMALGADRRRVVRRVVTGSMMGVGSGVALGLGLALALTRWLDSLLFEVSATDPTVFLRGTLVLLAVALLASALPARRASRVEPAVALRRE